MVGTMTEMNFKQLKSNKVKMKIMNEIKLYFYDYLEIIFNNFNRILLLNGLS